MRESLKKVARASRLLPLVNESDRRAVLMELAGHLLEKKGTILEANSLDLEKMEPTDPRYDRLLLSESRLEDIAQDLRAVAAMPSPLGEVLEHSSLQNKLELWGLFMSRALM
jgi:glutamate-5-semialdehyde dehydrogenase